MWPDFERDHPGDMQAQLKAWLICAEECVTSDERGCDPQQMPPSETNRGRSPTRDVRIIEN